MVISISNTGAPTISSVELQATSDLDGLLQLAPGRVVGLVGHPGLGLTRVGLAMLVKNAGKSPIAYLDVRGWLCPVAAWELGVDPEQLVERSSALGQSPDGAARRCRLDICRGAPWSQRGPDPAHIQFGAGQP